MKIDIHQQLKAVEERQANILEEVKGLDQKKEVLLNERKRLDEVWRSLEHVADVLRSTPTFSRPKKKGRIWTPEEKQAQAERMRGNQHAKGLPAWNRGLSKSA